MKKIFTIPMAFIALSSVSMGTGLIANKVMITDDSHIESMMVDNRYVSNARITAEAITDATIQVKTQWLNGMNVEGVSKISYTITSTNGGSGSTTIAKRSVTAGGPGANSEGSDVQEFTGLSAVKEYEITAKLYYFVSSSSMPEIRDHPAPITATTLPSNVTEPIVVLSSIGGEDGEAVGLTTTWKDGETEKASHISYVVTSSEQVTQIKSIETTSGTNTDTSIIPFPAAFIEGERLTITAKLHTNVAGDLVIEQPPPITEIMSNSNVTEAEIAIKGIDYTHRIINLTTIWKDGETEKVSHISYAIESSEQNPITEAIKPISNTNMDTTNVTFPSEFIGGEILTITATLYTNIAGDLIIEQPPTITEIMLNSNVTQAKIVSKGIDDTHRIVNLTTIWKDGVIEKVSHISYVIESSEQNPITEAIKPISSTNMDTTNVIFPSEFIGGEILTITATLYTNDQTADTIKEQPPEKVIKIEQAPTEMFMVAECKTDTKITIKNTWDNATIEKPIASLYSIATTIEPLVPIQNIIGTHVSREIITFTGLKPNTNYIITGELKFATSVRDFEAAITALTMTEKATKMTMVAEVVTDSSITIINTWVDGYIPVVSSSYTITELDKITTKATTTQYTQYTETITNDKIFRTETVIFGISDTPGPLTANTEYSITGTLNFEDGTSFDIATPIKVTTLALDTKMSGWEITGITLTLLMGVILLGLGGYWIYTKNSEESKNSNNFKNSI